MTSNLGKNYRKRVIDDINDQEASDTEEHVPKPSAKRRLAERVAAFSKEKKATKKAVKAASSESLSSKTVELLSDDVLHLILGSDEKRRSLWYGATVKDLREVVETARGIYKAKVTVESAEEERGDTERVALGAAHEAAQKLLDDEYKEYQAEQLPEAPNHSLRQADVAAIAAKLAPLLMQHQAAPPPPAPQPQLNDLARRMADLRTGKGTSTSAGNPPPPYEEDDGMDTH